MTISTHIDKKDVVVGNVYSVEEADVVLLLEDHDSREDFKKIERVINTYYRDSIDLILIERPKNSSYDHLINQERKLGPWRVKLLKGKNIAGWDHKLSEKWVTEYYQNPDVKDFIQAVDVLENLRTSDNIERITRSFTTLIRGLRHLEDDPKLLPPSDYENLVKQKDYQSQKFTALKNKLLNTGKDILVRMEEVYIKQTFSLRQNALLESLKRRTPTIKAKSGKIFVIMGEYHGNPFTSTHPAEVQKIINFIADKHVFVIL